VLLTVIFEAGMHWAPEPEANERASREDQDIPWHRREYARQLDQSEGDAQEKQQRPPSVPAPCHLL
jgi:hypothetical protein